MQCFSTGLDDKLLENLQFIVDGSMTQGSEVRSSPEPPRQLSDVSLSHLSVTNSQEMFSLHEPQL